MYSKSLSSGAESHAILMSNIGKWTETFAVFWDEQIYDIFIVCEGKFHRDFEEFYQLILFQKLLNFAANHNAIWLHPQ